MALSTIIETRINTALTAVADIGAATHQSEQASRFQWDSGVGANQADEYWSDERTVTTGATDSIDVAGAGGTRLLVGGALAFVKIKAIRVRNSNNAGTPNTTTISLTRPASNGVPFLTAAGDAIPIPPGGEVTIVNPSSAGYAVTGGTGDLIDIVNAAGASAVYRIEIIGTLS